MPKTYVLYTFSRFIFYFDFSQLLRLCTRNFEKSRGQCTNKITFYYQMLRMMFVIEASRNRISNRQGIRRVRHVKSFRI